MGEDEEVVGGMGCGDGNEEVQKDARGAIR